jgi:carboxyl-terminal processing protease
VNTTTRSKTVWRVLLVFLAACVTAPLRAQDWRAVALDSFDTAWQTIRDTYYDPSFGGLNWNLVRNELRPKAAAAPTPDAVRDVIREMLARLKRSHFVLLSASSTEDTLPGEAVVPIQIRVVPSGVAIIAVTDGSTAAVAGLRAGQLIVAVDGVSSDKWNETARTAATHTRDFAIWRQANRALHGAPGSVARLRIREIGGQERDVDCVRGAEAGESVRFGNLPSLYVDVSSRELVTPANRRVGLIAFSKWMVSINAPVDAAIDRFRHHDGLIFDLRGNPGGLAAMIMGVAGHVFAESVPLGRMRTRDATLEFRANPRVSTTDGRSVVPFAGPIVILVDELTGSTSECFAGALQSLGRARVFGRRTMGEALPASTKTLPNGDVLMFAVGDFVTPTGKSLEGEGVTPDVTVPLSLPALAAGRDEALESALKWLDTLGGPRPPTGSGALSWSKGGAKPPDQ